MIQHKQMLHNSQGSDQYKLLDAATVAEKALPPVAGQEHYAPFKPVGPTTRQK